MRTGTWLTVTLFVLLGLLHPTAGFAAPGDLDPTFGNGGRVADWPGSARGVAIQPDGKIIAVGWSHIPFSWDVAVARYNPDGSPDMTFGNAGKVSTPVYIALGSYIFGVDVAVQQDGKIVVTGYDDDQGLGGIVRFNQNGTLDASFGDNGVVRTAGGDYSVTVQADGKIITSAGVPFNSEFDYRIRRFNANGSIDTTFGRGDGVTDLPLFASSVVVQVGGKIVGAGGSSDQFAVARFNPDGTGDVSFGVSGLVTTPIGGTSSRAASLTTLPNGRIVAVGRSHHPLAEHFDYLVQYSQNGSLDTTFGNTGIVNLPTEFSWTHVAVQADGKVVVSGTSMTDDYALTRYNPNGSLDLTFGGGDGIATVDFGNSVDSLRAMALDHEGRAVLAGTSGGSNTTFAIARVLLSSPDVSITGRVTTPAGLGLRNAVVMLTDASGNARSVVTSSFGLYTFTNITIGQPYTLTVRSKRYRFTPRTLNVSGTLTGVDLVGLE